MRQVITLTVFLPFSVLSPENPLKPDDLWAALRMIGAAHFIFCKG